MLDTDPVDLDLPASEWPSPVRAELGVDKGGEQISVRGLLRAVAELGCVRCLRTFEFPVTVEFVAFADRSGTGRRSHEEAQLVRDRYMLFHDGRRVDLTAEAREALLLEISMAPRCREDCRGLCPRCGADLNEGPCDCSP
ncbi:MAG: DUF177 domain-containing protein [Candidatus Eisenbacteria bacterium]|nr:DUF177 domain-containing protein [Candidatus Eisenbacteria bacterium]